MARTPRVAGGADVATIEAISGQQAHVADDFVAVPNGTILNEHREVRRIQNLENNLKNHLGIERIPFNGIDELDTEQGPNGEVVHALNTGDSRIRFIGSGWREAVITGVSGGNNYATAAFTDVIGNYIEITFFGTGLNLLIPIDVDGRLWSAVVDGTTNITNIHPSNNATNALSAVLQENAEGNKKSNVVVPITSGLAAGIHTVRIVLGDGTQADDMRLFGCEVINESSTITQQPGADFSSNIELDAGANLPIRPALYTGSGGARVINYLTTSGSLNQTFTEALENVVEAGGQGTTYTVQLSTPGTPGTLTIPTGASTVRIITFGGGGSGGNVGGGGSGGGGGGGARAEVVYTRDTGNTSTLALTSSVGAANESTTASLGGTLVVTAGGANSANGFSAGAGGTPTIPVVDPGITGWTRTTTTQFTGSSGGTAGGGAGAAAGGVGGNTGTSVGVTVGSIPLFPLTLVSEIAGRAEGSGGGQTSVGDPVSTVTGAIPGGGGSGNTAGDNPTQGAGARGETYIIYTLAAAVDPVTNGTFTSAAAQEIGTPIEAFDSVVRTNQEIVRRINFREFGANTQFATLPATGNNNAAFTLDDGTTTLVGSSVVGGTISTGVDRMSISATGGTFTFTFVGTGLDILEGGIDGGTTIGSPQGVLVDGFNIGTYVPSTLPQITPIVSGLSYGTHTVRFLIPSTGANINPNVVDFIIYGPKKTGDTRQTTRVL